MAGSHHLSEAVPLMFDLKVSEHDQEMPQSHTTGQPMALRTVPISAVGKKLRLTADPVVASSIPGWSHTFGEIDHEIISTVILLLWLIQEGLLSVKS